MPTVSISGTNKAFEVKENEIIYDALFDRGEELPHGCLAGSCGACRIEVTSGGDNLSPIGAIEKNTVEAVIEELKKTKGDHYFDNRTVRLSCRAKILRNDVSIIALK